MSHLVAKHVFSRTPDAMPETEPLLGGGGPPAGIPGRACMYLLSWVFVFASVFLLAEFILYHEPSPPTNELINFFGTVEAILWFQGFMLLMYWSLYEVPINWTSTLGTFLKLCASVFFNIQPASGLIKSVEVGVLWSNFVGICLFHTGNIVSCYSMIGMFDSNEPASEKNLPVIGMWVYTVATTLLITADGLDYYNIEEAKTYVKYGQIFGATLLLVGSIIYAWWSRPSTYLPPSWTRGGTSVQ